MPWKCSIKDITGIEEKDLNQAEKKLKKLLLNQ
jgi:hypothetical protein